MICSASRGDDMIVEEEDLNRAINLLAEAEIKMGTVFRGMGKSDISGLVNDAIQFLYRFESGNEIPLFDLARRLEGDADKFTLDRVLQTLEMMRLIKVIKKPGMDPMLVVIKDN
jgi:hypothetical protein